MSCEVLIAVALQWCWNLFELGPSTRLPDAWFSNSQNGLVKKVLCGFLMCKAWNVIVLVSFWYHMKFLPSFHVVKNILSRDSLEKEKIRLIPYWAFSIKKGLLIESSKIFIRISQTLKNLTKVFKPFEILGSFLNQKYPFSGHPLPPAFAKGSTWSGCCLYQQCSIFRFSLL